MKCRSGIFLYRNLEIVNENSVNVFYMDFEEASHLLIHETLLMKQNRIGICWKILKFLHLSLPNQVFRVQQSCWSLKWITSRQWSPSVVSGIVTLPNFYEPYTGKMRNNMGTPKTTKPPLQVQTLFWKILFRTRCITNKIRLSKKERYILQPERSKKLYSLCTRHWTHKVSERSETSHNRHAHVKRKLWNLSGNAFKAFYNIKRSLSTKASNEAKLNPNCGLVVTIME